MLSLGMSVTKSSSNTTKRVMGVGLLGTTAYPLVLENCIVTVKIISIVFVQINKSRLYISVF